MADVSTNGCTFTITEEASLGVLPGTLDALILEPNSIGRAGAEIKTVQRMPISKNRQNRHGATVDLDSGWEAELDLTREHWMYFLPGALFADYATTTPRSYVHPVLTAVTSTGYTVTANGDLPDNTLIYARGFSNDANNGLKVTAGTSTTTEIKTTGLTAEAAIPHSQNAMVEVAGRRGATGDLQINASGNLISTVLDFTTLRLNPGQFIWVGGDAAAQTFAVAANRGLARIVSISANVIVLDKKTSTFATDNGSGKQIDIFFGRWIRNVPTDHADYSAKSYTIETTYPDLESGPAAGYSYSEGNQMNTFTLNLPGQDKATISVAMLGLDTDGPDSARTSGFSDAREPVSVVAFNTVDHFNRLRVTETDETGLTSYFKSATVTFNNNVTPEKVIGTLGAAFMNAGMFDVKIETSIILTDSAVIEAVRANRLLTMELGMRCDDGGFIIDFPAATLGNGKPEFPKDEHVLVSCEVNPVMDVDLGYTCSVSNFPYLPSA